MAHHDERSGSLLDRDLRTVAEEAAERWWARYPAAFGAVRATIGSAYVALGTVVLADLATPGDGVVLTFVRAHPAAAGAGFWAWIAVFLLVFVWPFARPSKPTGPVGTALTRIARGVFLGAAALAWLKHAPQYGLVNFYLLGSFSVLYGVEIAVRDAEI